MLQSPQRPETLSDLDLLLRFRAGERDALGTLAQRHERALLGLALGLLGGRRDLAADAVQNTWVKVIRSAHTFDQRSSLKTWLSQITLNAARDLRTAAHTRQKRDHDPLNHRAPPDHEAPPTLDALTPLRRAVDELPDHQREVVLLCYHAGLTHAIVAELLAIPPGTVKSRLHAALTALRAALPSEVIP